MKPLFEKVHLSEQNSFLLRSFDLPEIDAPWHYHPEYELAYIVNGSGKRFVGDHVENFESGDLILVGANLPHYWKCDNTPTNSQWIVIQWPEQFVDQIRAIPELRQLNQLMYVAERGINFSASLSRLIGAKMMELEQQKEVRSFFGFLEILELLTSDTDRKLLASESYQISTNQAESDRMKRILEFTVDNFHKEINLDQVAEVAHLTTSAFCRYFKQRTKKSYIDYLNEFRISHARKLLIDSGLGVGQICFECGFNNLSNFHRLFKRLTNLSPMQYAKLYRKI
jgi:AraC-like DNA-binding protein